MAEKINAGEFAFPDQTTRQGQEARVKRQEKVTWHDSCHIGRASGVYEPPRELIKAIPSADFVEMPFNREEAHCCGSVLTLMKDPEVAAEIGNESSKRRAGRRREDPGALPLLRVPAAGERGNAKGKDIEVVDLAHFAAEALGFELPGPEPRGREAVGGLRGDDRADDPAGLRRPHGHDVAGADRRDALRHGRDDARDGEGAGALEAMKPMFPILFPRLLPMMMPKVMPTMLERSAERCRCPTTWPSRCRT